MATRSVKVPDEVSSANEAERRLLSSALASFSEKGYEGTSIREIIERAGVTRPVLYYYFENKEHLFRRLVESWFTELVEDMDRALEGVVGLREQLKTLIVNVFEHAERSPHVVRLIFHTFFAPRHGAPKLDRDSLWESRYSRIAKIMQSGIESGEFARHSCESLAMAFCGMMDMHIMVKINRPHTTLSNELGEALVDLFLEGARAQKS
ncbi:MAG: TetR/AcrR family transcriptional regulator [Candidatus Hydrogenedentes bacterium]|nr:TetR/AcrR family transcriptional regulator [Candidatus Hydrogenedentota bacterium]